MNSTLLIQDRLLGKITAAEKMAALMATLPEGELRTVWITRWAIVADEAAALTHLAAELLPENDLKDLEDRVNAEDETTWDRYHTSERRFKRLIGKELWELGR